MVKQRKIGIKSYSDFGGMITGIHFNAGSCQSNHSEKFYFPHYKYLHESTCCTSVLILIVQRLCQLERRFQPNDYYPCIHKKLRSGALLADVAVCPYQFRKRYSTTYGSRIDSSNALFNGHKTYDITERLPTTISAVKVIPGSNLA